MGKSHGNVMWRSLRLGRRSPDYIVNDAREYFAAKSVTADISTIATRKNALECIGDNANTDKIPSPYKPDSRLYKNLIPPTPTPPGPARRRCASPSRRSSSPFAAIRCKSHSPYPFLFLHPSILITQNGTFPFLDMQGRKGKRDKVLTEVLHE